MMNLKLRTFVKNSDKEVILQVDEKAQTAPQLGYSRYQLESLARVLLPIMQEYLASEEGQKDYEEWQKQKLNNEQQNKEKEPH